MLRSAGIWSSLIETTIQVLEGDQRGLLLMNRCAAPVFERLAIRTYSGIVVFRRENPCVTSTKTSVVFSVLHHFDFSGSAFRKKPKISSFEFEV